MNRQYVKLSWLCAQLVLLSACAKSGIDTLQSGIEGSGHQITTSNRITTSGVVTALGSIFVNNVEYDLTGATVTINGSPALESDLAPGLVTIVEGQIGPDGTRGIATRVTVESECGLRGSFDAGVADSLGLRLFRADDVALDGRRRRIAGCDHSLGGSHPLTTNVPLSLGLEQVRAALVGLENRFGLILAAGQLIAGQCLAPFLGNFVIAFRLG